MPHNEIARFQRYAKNNWQGVFAKAVDADEWGQAEEALNEYENISNLLGYQLADLDPTPADTILASRLRAVVALRARRLIDVLDNGDDPLAHGYVSALPAPRTKASVSAGSKPGPTYGLTGAAAEEESEAAVELEALTASAAALAGRRGASAASLRAMQPMLAALFTPAAGALAAAAPEPEPSAADIDAPDPSAASASASPSPEAAWRAVGLRGLLAVEEQLQRERQWLSRAEERVTAAAAAAAEAAEAKAEAEAGAGHHGSVSRPGLQSGIDGAGLSTLASASTVGESGLAIGLGVGMGTGTMMGHGHAPGLLLSSPGQRGGHQPGHEAYGEGRGSGGGYGGPLSRTQQSTLIGVSDLAPVSAAGGARGMGSKARALTGGDALSRSRSRSRSHSRAVDAYGNVTSDAGYDSAAANPNDDDGALSEGGGSVGGGAGGSDYGSDNGDGSDGGRNGGDDDDDDDGANDGHAGSGLGGRRRGRPSNGSAATVAVAGSGGDEALENETDVEARLASFTMLTPATKTKAATRRALALTATLSSSVLAASATGTSVAGGAEGSVDGDAAAVAAVAGDTLSSGSSSSSSSATDRQQLQLHVPPFTSTDGSTYDSSHPPAGSVPGVPLSTPGAGRRKSAGAAVVGVTSATDGVVSPSLHTVPHSTGPAALLLGRTRAGSGASVASIGSSLPQSAAAAAPVAGRGRRMGGVNGAGSTGTCAAPAARLWPAPSTRFVHAHSTVTPTHMPGAAAGAGAGAGPALRLGTAGRSASAMGSGFSAGLSKRSASVDNGGGAVDPNDGIAFFQRLTSYSQESLAPGPGEGRPPREGGPGLLPLAPPLLGRGETAVAITIERIDIKGAAAFRDPRMTLTLVDEMGSAVGPVVDTGFALPGPPENGVRLAWNPAEATVFLQEPLERISEGWAVVLELRHSKKEYLSTKCWGFLDREELASSDGLSLALELYEKPADFTRNPKKLSLFTKKQMYLHVIVRHFSS